MQFHVGESPNQPYPKYIQFIPGGRDKCWRVNVYDAKIRKFIYVGVFDELQEAIDARNEFCRKHDISIANRKNPSPNRKNQLQKESQSK